MSKSGELNNEQVVPFNDCNNLSATSIRFWGLIELFEASAVMLITSKPIPSLLL
jgi:hypothetical protein